jgi:outer membrane protein TolC
MLMRLRKGPRLVGPSVLAAILSSLSPGCTMSPSPATDLQVAAYVTSATERAYENQEPISAPVDLYQAMARSLKYNLDKRVADVETTLAEKEVQVASERALPNIVAGSAFAHRNTDYALSSRSALTGQQSLEPSIAQERSNVTSDLALGWSILDFGLSYVRARQAADAGLIAGEVRRKATMRLVEDVRSTYWRAVVHDRAARKLRQVQGLIARALAKSRRVATPELKDLFERRALLEGLRDLRALVDELAGAKAQLASLMNVPAGTDFRLVAEPHAVPRLKSPMSRADMLRSALQKRPEIRDAYYRNRIKEYEVNAALLELLPGIQLYAANNQDDNPFLTHHNWINYSTRVSWNLLKILQYPARRDSIKAQAAVLDRRALAVASAVTLQIDLSRMRMTQAGAQLRAAHDLLDIQLRIISQFRQAAASGAASEIDLIQEELRTFWAATKYDLMYAQLHSAFAALCTAIGEDPADGDLVRQLSVDKLADRLRATVGQRGT